MVSCCETQRAILSMVRDMHLVIADDDGQSLRTQCREGSGHAPNAQ